MKRVHAFVIAGILGVAAVAGTFAATTSTSLGVEATGVSDAEIATREKTLRKAERRLARAAKRQPPALQVVPTRRGSAVLASAPVARSSGGGPGPSANSGRGSHHGDEHEHEDDGRGRGRGRGRGGDDRDDRDDDRDDDDWDDD